jgi:hypothetical protein
MRLRRSGPALLLEGPNTLIYRLYCFDGANKVWTADSVEAPTDKAAIIAARGMDIGIKCEIWQGSRLVATLTPDTPAASTT